jgi:hypothetical protein
MGDAGVVEHHVDVVGQRVPPVDVAEQVKLEGLKLES